jgi:hypothetical protein
LKLIRMLRLSMMKKSLKMIWGKTSKSYSRITRMGKIRMVLESINLPTEQLISQASTL